MTREALLVHTMVELADSLVDDFDIVDLLATLAERCVDVLDVAAVGIMLAAPDGELLAMTSSDETMRTVELFELQSREGPCLDCYRSGQPVVNQDLTRLDGRWPRFAQFAVEAGFLAADAIPMRLRGQVIGVLNLFRDQTGSLSSCRRDGRPGARRRRHHRHSSAPSRSGHGRRQRPAAERAGQSGTDRAGQGDARRTRADPGRRRLRAPSRPCPEPQPPAHRRRPRRHRERR